MMVATVRDPQVSAALATLLFLHRLTVLMTEVVDTILARGVTSNSEVAIILETHRGGAVSPSDLAAHLGLTASRVSRHLSALRRAGLVIITEADDDRRRRTVSLTARGRRRVQNFSAAVNTAYRDQADEIARAIAALTPHSLPAPAHTPNDPLEVTHAISLAGARYVADAAHRLDTLLPDSSFSQRYSILLLAEQDALTPGDIAVTLHRSPSHATRVIASLETAGLLTRAPAPDDGRSTRLSLTEPGLRAAEILINTLDTHAHDLAEHLAAALHTQHPR